MGSLRPLSWVEAERRLSSGGAIGDGGGAGAGRRGRSRRAGQWAGRGARAALPGCPGHWPSRRSPRSGSRPWGGGPPRCGRFCCSCCCRRRRCPGRCAGSPAPSLAAARPTAPCAAPARGPASADCEYAAPPPRHPRSLRPPCLPALWSPGC